MYTISSGKTSRLNCPGGQALLTQMLSPGETKQLADSVFYYYCFIQISFVILLERLSSWLIQFFIIIVLFKFPLLLAAVYTVGN